MYSEEYRVPNIRCLYTELSKGIVAPLSLYTCPEDFVTEGPSLSLTPFWHTLQELEAEQLTVLIHTDQDPGLVLK